MSQNGYVKFDSIKYDEELKYDLVIENCNQLSDDQICLEGNDYIDKLEKEKLINRSFIQRIFGKIEPGSIRGSIFSMIILTLGPGCLAIPKTVGDMSLIVGLTSLILSALASYWTLYTLSHTSQKYKIFKYSDLVRHIIGNKLGIVVDVFIIIGTIGILVLYKVVCKN
jgi:hypothetical protein